MKTKQALLLDAVRTIRRMERGTLCRLRRGPNGDYYNHQSWEQGRNRVSYVPASQVAALQEAIAEYNRFMELVKSYAEEVIQETRRRMAQEAGGAVRKPSRPAYSRRQRSKRMKPREGSAA